VRISVHNCRTQQHRTVLIILPLILQAITIVQMMSAGGRVVSISVTEGVIFMSRMTVVCTFCTHIHMNN